MRFLIEIAGEDQPALIRSLDQVRETLIAGDCHLGVQGITDAHLRPDNQGTATLFHTLYEEAHPQPKAPWTKEPCAK